MPPRLTLRDLDAFDRLLADPDPRMVEILAGKLVAFADADFARILQRHAITSENCPPPLTEAFRRRAALRFALIMQTAGSRPDLETALVMLSAWGRPDLSTYPIVETLDGFAEEIHARRGWAEVSLKDVLELLFQDRGFRGNRGAYDDTNNTWLAAVLQRRLGIPVSLCALMLLVARRLKLAVRPIAAPGHFLLGTKVRGREHYIDCFDSGCVLDRDAALARMPSLATGQNPFPITTTRDVVARTLRNLVNLYTAQGEVARLRDLAVMSASLAPSASPSRES